MKVGISIDGDDFAEYYEATVVSVVDYYPFGSSMAGRKFNQGSYRYGFNGKEEDKEWGRQMIQDYGFRIYNPTIGKFLSVDPLAPDYPWYSPYQFAGNMPIWAIDLDGREPDYTNGKYNVQSGQTLHGIENELGYKRGTLEKLNPQLDNINHIEVGWKINIAQKTELGLIYPNEAKITSHTFQDRSDVEMIAKSPNRMYTQVKRGDKLSDGSTIDHVNNDAGEKTLELGIATVMATGGVALQVGMEAWTLSGAIRSASSTKAKPSSIGAKSSSTGAKSPFTKGNTGKCEKLGGREIIIDENLSPTLGDKLAKEGFNVTLVEKGTLDSEIIEYAGLNNATVLTNNIKDFKAKGVRTIKVSERLKKGTSTDELVKRMNKAHDIHGSEDVQHIPISSEIYQ